MPRPASPEASFARIVEELVRRSNEEIRRIRDLEQRIDGLEAKASTLEHLILEKDRKSGQKASELEQRLSTLADEVIKIRSLLEKAAKQMERFATRTEVRELENAFNLLSIEKHPAAFSEA